jgi:hypothetical protein
MQAALNRARLKWGSQLGPAFLMLVLLAFLVLPGTTIDKFNMLCFGI